MIEATLQIRAQGFGKPYCLVVHALFAEAAYATLQNLTARIISTDTIKHESNAISVATLPG